MPVIFVIIRRLCSPAGDLVVWQLRQLHAGDAFQVVGNRPGLRLKNLEPRLFELGKGAGTDPIDDEGRMAIPDTPGKFPTKAVTILRGAVGNFDQGARGGIDDHA